MSNIKKFSVTREHRGDKPYAENDVREASQGDVQHLIDSGVLLDDGGAKAEAAPKNKMEPDLPNKGGGRPPKKA